LLCVFKEILYERNKMRVDLGHQMEGYLCKNKKWSEFPPPLLACLPECLRKIALIINICHGIVFFTYLRLSAAFWSSCSLMSSRVFGAVAGIRSKVHLAISSNFLTRVFPPGTVEKIKISIPKKTKRGLKSPNTNATLLLLRQKNGQTGVKDQLLGHQWEGIYAKGQNSPPLLAF